MLAERQKSLPECGEIPGYGHLGMSAHTILVELTVDACHIALEASL